MAQIKADCLKDVVGVTETECECVIGGLTEEQVEAMRVSTSGLYMDREAGAIHMKSAAHADQCADLAVLSLSARDNAVRETVDDLVIAVNNRYSQQAPGTPGVIGRHTFSSTMMQATKTYQGTRIRFTSYDASRVMRLKSVELVLNVGGQIDFKIFRRIPGTTELEEIKTQAVTVAANSYSQVANIKGTVLPFMYMGQLAEYYLVWEKPNPGVFPKDVDFGCSSCGKGVKRYAEYFAAEGVEFTNPADISDLTSDTYTHGVVVNFEIACDTGTLFCKEYDQNNAVAVALSWAVMFKANELLIGYVLKSPDVNRFTMMDRETLEKNMLEFRAKYEFRINYVAQTMNLSATDCFVCREAENQPRVAGLIS